MADYPTAIRSTGVGWVLGVERIGSIVGPVTGGLLLGAGWSVQSVLLALVAVVSALLAAMAVVALRGRGPLSAAMSSAVTLQH